MPVLILSVRSDVSHKIEALDAGADETKPFAVGKLLTHLRLLLRNRRSADEAHGASAATVFRSPEAYAKSA